MEVKWVPLLPLNVDCGGCWMCELQNDGVEVLGMWGDGLALCRRLGDCFTLPMATWREGFLVPFSPIVTRAWNTCSA